MFKEETTKPANKINFEKLLHTVLSTSFYENFFENLLNDDANSESQPVLKYVISLFIKVLNHRYAKHLLNLCQATPSKGSAGLRVQLKGKCIQ